MRIRWMTLKIGEPPQGFVFIMGGGANISWSNKWQPIIILSTTKTKYMASAQATKEAIWMTKLMKELGYMKEKKAMVIWCDNQGAMSLMNNSTQMFKQNTLMFNITLLKNELKLAKLCLIFVQQRTWLWMWLPKYYQKNNITSW